MGCGGKNGDLADYRVISEQDGGNKVEAYRDVIEAENFAAHTAAADPNQIIALPFNAEETEATADIKKPLQDYIKSARALFATGGMDPNNDADWQKYLDELETQGLSKYVETAQKAYDRLYK